MTKVRDRTKATTETEISDRFEVVRPDQPPTGLRPVHHPSISRLGPHGLGMATPARAMAEGTSGGARVMSPEVGFRVGAGVAIGVCG